MGLSYLAPKLPKIIHNKHLLEVIDIHVKIVTRHLLGHLLCVSTLTLILARNHMHAQILHVVGVSVFAVTSGDI
jgi:hypothetical protein